MRIRRIQLYRFRGFDDLQLLFPKDSNLIAFIGENGSGKTSLLEGISMILQDSLYKHHKYDKVDWNNPLNVQNPHKKGSIAIGLQVPKLSFDFSQSLSADRTRFISEDKLILEKNRELTDEEKIEHYKTQAEMAFHAEKYEKALEEFFKLIPLQEKVLGFDSADLAKTYHRMGNCYYRLKNYIKCDESVIKAIEIQEKILAPDDVSLVASYHLIGVNNIFLKKYQIGIKFLKKAVEIQEKISDADNEEFAKLYYNTGVTYDTLNDKKKAIEYYEKAIVIREKILTPDDSSLLKIYKNLGIAYKNLGFSKQATLYEEKAKDLNTDDKKIDNNIPELYFTNDENSLKNFNEYVELWATIVLHYSARQLGLESFKDALPMAFHIPMTTDFELISDWFIEQENEENRKRLRIETEYRSTELATIREVITRGLTLLNGENGVHFTELQTEIDETVKDGQISSWLSIKKNDKRLNVKQLSDGEKRVLILLIDITRRLITVGKINNTNNFLEGTGIVLIDEIEQHLHPKWQRMLPSTLNQLFPKLQFVLTTHSPQVLSYIPNGCAFSLENGKAFPQNTYGRDNEWILEKIMEDVNRPVEVKAKLDEYFDAIRDDKDTASVLRTELEKLIGEDEPELLRADILIRRKQKSISKNEAN